MLGLLISAETELVRTVLHRTAIPCKLSRGFLILDSYPQVVACHTEAAPSAAMALALCVTMPTNGNPTGRRPHLGYLTTPPKATGIAGSRMALALVVASMCGFCHSICHTT